ncbi:hypothetical protein PBCVCan184_584L [Paramecium bursaria Chlorella virus Can18-4]|nr:hypothetical protein PBCVCan184_584L [Paramecium bursaria Chlorella virus Can18-4]
MSEDALMNATPINKLPSPPAPISTSVSEKLPGETASYTDLIKNLDINKMSQATSMSQMPPMPHLSQLSQQPPQMQNALPPTPQMMMQTPVNPSAQNNVMQQMQNQASMYSGGMPQSSPISEFLPHEGTPVHQGPLKSELLPDPMFFQNPPPKQKVKKIYIDKTPAVQEQAILGFNAKKIKHAVLVSSIVFLLIWYVAPMMARNLQWTVNVDTGKFTSYGLVAISALTGGLYLGVTSIIERFGNGML